MKFDDVVDFAKIVARRYYGEPYRGYKFMDIGFGVGTQASCLYAYMKNSPIHPNDIMYQWSHDVPNDRDGIIRVIHAAVDDLKKLIDLAHDDPKSFSKDPA